MKEEVEEGPSQFKDKLETLGIKDGEISVKRELSGFFSTAVFIVGLAMSLVHIYALTIRAIDPWYFRTIHIVFGGILIYALVPGWKKAAMDRIHLIDYLFLFMIVAPAVYTFIEFDELIYRAGVVPNTWDFIFSLMFVISILEMTRRTTGLALMIISIVFILYGHFGQYMPGLFVHRGYTWARMITFLFSLDGILGLPILASAHYVFLFVLFGAFVEASGAGKFFVDFARCAAGRFRGGPAKVSVVSSAIIGTASGSSVANVVVDGVFNIPMMKASGFTPTIAGAIEAMTSTGGQIMPPVMAAAAFLMAEILAVPYAKVALAAAIPAILYYSAGYWMIDFYSASIGLKGIGRQELPVFRQIMMEKGYLLVPIVVLLISLMVLMYSPNRSAILAILSLIAISWVSRKSRLGLKRVVEILGNGAKGAMEIVATCAAAGIIVGILTQTGLGMKFAMIIISYSGGNLFLALAFTMIIAIILGMGMPTTAAYAISASVLAPALIQMKVAPIAAHLFIFYFAVLSALTPPVALAAYAAAALANAKAWNVGWQGMRFALAGFIIPYMFVYGPAMVLVGSPSEIVLAVVTGFLGTLALAASIQGWLLTRTQWAERGVLFIAALGLIKPGWISDIVGLVLLIIVLVLQYARCKRETVEVSVSS
jgi:TRAP transporter 4TM/12TM fusion protein